MITNIYLVCGATGPSVPPDVWDVVSAPSEAEAMDQGRKLFPNHRIVWAESKFTGVDLNPIKRWPSGNGVIS